MAGVKGAGWTKERRAQKEREAGLPPVPHRSKATVAFTERLQEQAGDRLYCVERRYPTGEWFVVGNIESAKEETVGGFFGGGTYRVYELNKATEERTGRLPLSMKLSPAKWPVKQEFALLPQDAEDEQLSKLAPDDEDEIAGGKVAGSDLATIAARIEAKVRRELEAQTRLNELERSIKFLTEHPPQQQASSSPLDQLAMMRELMSLMRDMMPPPALNPVMPASPIQTLTESIAAIKALKGDLATLGMGDGPKENPVLSKLTESLVSLGEKALVNHRMTQATPHPQGTRQLPAQTTQQTQTVEAPAAPSKEQVERDFQIMVNELTQKLAADQADQLSGNAKTHISETAGWIQGKWSGDQAPTVWVNMKQMLKQYPDADVLMFLSANAPQLTDTEPKKAWLLQVISLIRKA